MGTKIDPDELLSDVAFSDNVPTRIACWHSVLLSFTSNAIPCTKLSYSVYPEDSRTNVPPDSNCPFNPPATLTADPNALAGLLSSSLITLRTYCDVFICKSPSASSASAVMLCFVADGLYTTVDAITFIFFSSAVVISSVSPASIAGLVAITKSPGRNVIPTTDASILPATVLMLSLEIKGLSDMFII